MEISLDHLMQGEFEKIQDLTEVLESVHGRLTPLEISFPFKQEHMIKLLKTFLFMVKAQEERQKFALADHTRLFENLMQKNQT